jgi:nicotinamidase-related amidase
LRAKAVSTNPEKDCATPGPSEDSAGANRLSAASFFSQQLPQLQRIGRGGALLIIVKIDVDIVLLSPRSNISRPLFKGGRGVAASIPAAGTMTADIDEFGRSPPRRDPATRFQMRCILASTCRISLPRPASGPRFITPVSADDRPGRWQRDFARWDCATQPRLPPGALDIVSPLARFIPPATVIDKPGYSAFFASSLQSFLAEKSINTLIISGSETDVCVLATVLDAVDRGFRVIVVEDRLCNSSDQGHDALMMLYRTRFTEQIELLALDAVLDLWQEAS